MSAAPCHTAQNTCKGSLAGCAAVPGLSLTCWCWEKCLEPVWCFKIDHEAGLVTHWFVTGRFLYVAVPRGGALDKQEEPALAILIFRPVNSLRFCCFTLPLPQNSQMLLILDDAFA